MDIKNEAIFHKVAEALLVDYESIYYINTQTDDYVYFSMSDRFKSLHLEEEGHNFFENMARDAIKVVHPDDQKIFTEELSKDSMQWNTKYDILDAKKYRLIIDGKPIWHVLRILRGFEDSEDYLILGVMNIDENVKLQQGKSELDNLHKTNKEFIEAVKGFVGHFKEIYYVNLKTDIYVQVDVSNLLGILSGEGRQENYFGKCRRIIEDKVYEDDKPLLINFFDKEILMRRFKMKSTARLQYRAIEDGNIVLRDMLVIITNDNEHLLVCIESME